MDENKLDQAIEILEYSILSYYRLQAKETDERMMPMVRFATQALEDNVTRLKRLRDGKPVYGE